MMESFFLEEDLGPDPIRSCKSQVKESKFCSSEGISCRTPKKLEIRYQKDNCKFEASVERLISKYPWSSDPVILKDNGLQALASQCNLEDRQLKDNNFVNYDKCSQDVLD